MLACLALWFVLDQPSGRSIFDPAGALIALWLSTWLCDSAAYFVGMAFGKHQPFPAASPNKTVEGFREESWALLPHRS